MPECKGCRTGIEFKTGSDGKSHPFNLDGTPHICPAYRQQMKGQPAAPQQKKGDTIIGRIEAYEGSNVKISGKFLFLIPEDRKLAQEKHPVGSVVNAMYDKGTCKGMTEVTGGDLEKFLKGEEARRNQQTQAQPAAAPSKQTEPSPAPAAKQESCTSPAAAPVEQRKGPAEESRMPTRKELIGMVYSSETYWKAKTLMDIEAHDSICKQVEIKNWLDCVNSAIEYHQRDEDGCSDITDKDLEDLFKTATAIHDFVARKTGGA